MGTTVLDASTATDLHLYAHCHPTMHGAVTMLAINISRRASHALTLPLASGALHAGCGNAAKSGRAIERNGARAHHHQG